MGLALGTAFLKTVLFLAGAFLFSRFLLPQLLYRVAAIRNRKEIAAGKAIFRRMAKTPGPH